MIISLRSIPAMCAWSVPYSGHLVTESNGPDKSFTADPPMLHLLLAGYHLVRKVGPEQGLLSSPKGGPLSSKAQLHPMRLRLPVPASNK